MYYQTFILYWIVVLIIIVLIVKSCIRRVPPGISNLSVNFTQYKLNVVTHFVSDLPQYSSQDTLMSTQGIFMTFAQRPSMSQVDLSSLMRPCFDQGSLGSCTAQALIGASQQVSSKRMDSPLFLQQNSRLLDGSVNRDAGSQISTGIRAMQKYGLSKETTWPQIVSKFKTKPSNQAYKEALTKKVKTAYQVPIQHQAIQNWLSSGFPVVVGIRVYKSFQNASKNGMVPMPGVKDPQLGGHAVVLVGYNDSSQLYKVRNSWGPLWGVSGYFQLPYSYITKPQMASDLWVIVKSDNPN